MMQKIILTVCLLAFTATSSPIQASVGKIPSKDAKPEAANFLHASAPKDSKAANELAAAMKDVQESPSVSSTAESRAATMASMETAVMNLLLGKNAFGATPMGGSVKKIIHIIKNEMMPKVRAAHNMDQRQLRQLIAELKKCGNTKNSQTRSAQPWYSKYLKNSGLHKRCRADEAVKYSSYRSCLKQQKALNQIKKLKCNLFSQVSKRFGNSFNNKKIVTKAAGEKMETYLSRISTTICGKHVHGKRGRRSARGGWGGGLLGGFYDKYLKAKGDCSVAAGNYQRKVKECKRKIQLYNVKKGKCNQFQTLMDSRSCKHAVMMKDTCESYAGCYHAKLKAYRIVERKVRHEERDRKAEWRGLSRMQCLINGFADGKITDKEVDACKKRTVNTRYFIIKYPKIPPLQRCVVTKLYPSTGAYKRREFAPLPTLAKGRASPACSGVEEVSTKPRKGSPRSCKCRRVTLEGPYKAGPLVKCTNCRDVRKSRDTNSCPIGTKIFSPQSKSDWSTFFRSAKALRHPHFIIDVTRPQNGCGGCTSNPMNSGNRKQSSWKTSDGSPWWLRSNRYNEPNGDYAANCYLGMRRSTNARSVTFNDGRCLYHSRSYYCQKKKLGLSPRPGSPRSCKCELVTLTGRYSPGRLVKCQYCHTVRRSRDKNSCPIGMKIFSPRSRSDWKTFISSAQPLRAPYFIIDVTRPQNGCGGCTKSAMNSKNPRQATWKTSDGSAWWLRSTRYNEPNGDYSANCFMDLWKAPRSENAITMNDWRCKYYSRSYYCQPIQVRKATRAKAIRGKKIIKRTPFRRLVAKRLLKGGFYEEAFYFNQGGRIPNLARRTPDMVRAVGRVWYKRGGRAWPGFSRADQFAVRWSGYLIVPKRGNYRFEIGSDDGSKLYINKRLLINNDGLHGHRVKQSGNTLLVLGQQDVRIEFFERTGGASMTFRWVYGRNRWRVVTGRNMKYVPPAGFTEEVYYIGGMKRLPNFRRRPDQRRIVNLINYANTGGTWPKFRRSNDFAVRWLGVLRIQGGGLYRFSLASDDGSRMRLNGRVRLNNDGLHGLRKIQAGVRMRPSRYAIVVEFFERGGHAGCYFKYMGRDTKNRMVFPSGHRRTVEAIVR